MKLSEKESLVIQARLMFKNDLNLSLKWLESKGFPMKKTQYYNTLNRLDSMGAERLFEIAKTFPAFHADEIEKFVLIEQQLYEQYYQEKAPINKARILKMIADIQPLITALHDSTQYILETNGKFTEFLSRKQEERAE